jgi:hypothetical protein
MESAPRRRLAAAATSRRRASASPRHGDGERRRSGIFAFDGSKSKALLLMPSDFALPCLLRAKRFPLHAETLLSL